MPASRPLLLTGGPAVGKTVTARALAESTARCAYIDVDDVRQFVKSGGAAPWDGEEGRAQHILGVRNAAALAANFRADGFDVTMSDVIDAELLQLYRELVPGIMVIRLSITRAMARSRAQTRRVYLTDQEFETLHRQQLAPLETDADIEVSGLTLEAQIDAVRAAWLRI
jgi:predicted kinase